MTEPSLTLQAAIRSRLLRSPEVMNLVAADQVRDGSGRPENFPCIIIGDGQTVLAGHAGTYRTVEVFADLHIWTLEAGLEGAKAMGGAVWNALGRELDVAGYDLHDGIHVEAARYVRDPSAEHGHAIISVRAFMGCLL